MIRTLLIDDEQHCIEMLRYEIQIHCPGIEIVGKAVSGAEGIEKIRELKPTLVFLDIEMPGMNGFEMLHRLKPVDFDVIFVTAYDQYAIRAFRFAALDYLLKPVSGDHLKEAVGRMTKGGPEKDQQGRLDALLHNLREGLKSPRIALPVGRGMDIVDVSEIMYCAAESNYTHVHLRNGKKYTMAKTLKDTGQILDQPEFIRIHQSWLINIDHVQRYLRDDGGYAVMRDGVRVPIAKRKKEEFMSRLRHS
jgi:two-component system LytT family response regulator